MTFFNLNVVYLPNTNIYKGNKQHLKNIGYIFKYVAIMFDKHLTLV